VFFENNGVPTWSSPYYMQVSMTAFTVTWGFSPRICICLNE